MVQRRTCLMVAGAILEAIFLVAVWRLPWWWYGGRTWKWAHILGEGTGTLLACLFGALGLMLAYLWGWYLVRKGGGERRIVWGFSVVFAATLFWLLPMTSDLFNYLSKAHIFTDLGANPFVHAPLDFRDPLVLAYPTSYARQPSIYGPVWALLSGLGTLGPHDVVAGVFYLKGLAAVAYLSAAWLLERILREVRPAFASEALYLFAWNPLVVFMAIGDGHNDIVMMAMSLLATWLLLRKRWVLAFAVLALSVWIKYVSIVLFPLFVLYVWRQLDWKPSRARWSILGTAGLATVLVSILVFVPFGGQGILQIGERLLHPTNWRGGSEDLASGAFKVGLLMFAAAYLVLIVRVARDRGSFRHLGTGGFVALFLAVVFGVARSQPWHLIWPAALAGLAESRWAWPAIIGLSGILLVVQIWVEWSAPGVSTWSMMGG